MRSWTRFGGIALALAAAVLLAWWAAWHVDDPVSGPVRPTWQTASVKDCDVMAKALLAFPFARGADPPMLAANVSDQGPCDWARYGLHESAVTAAQFEAKCPRFGLPDCVYILLSRPNYSWLRLRAAVEVADVYGNLGADGYVCNLHKDFSGWTLESCRKTWIS